MRKTMIALTAVLALIALAVGFMKVVSPIADLNESQAWTLEFDTWQVRAIGIAEVAAAVGLAIPLVTRRFLVLGRVVPVALAALMIGAIGTHVRISDPVADMVPATVVLILSAAVGWLWATQSPGEARTA